VALDQIADVAQQPAQPAAQAQVLPASLVEFERAIARRDYQTALAHAVGILARIDRSMGGIEGVDMGSIPNGIEVRDLYQRFATRFAAGFCDLIINGGAAITPLATETLFLEHRWLDNIFAISGFQNTDHMAIHFGGGAPGQWRLGANNLIAFLLLFMPSSSALAPAFDECMSVNRAATIVALIAYLSARICVTPGACAFRERMLQWLPGRFGDTQLGTVPLARMTEPFTHCSYAMDPRKHELKRDLIAQMHAAAIKAGCREFDPAKPPPKRKRPRIVIVTEHFTAGHAIHRTHSQAVRALRERFEVIGILHGDPKEPTVLDCFDEIIRFPVADLFTITKNVSDAILAREPDIVFHLGVGLTVTAIALASLRLAPVQCVSYGHTATTMSPAIDYMVLPEDFVTTKDCYSEELLLLPKTAFPYTPRIIDTASVEAAIAAAPNPDTESVVRVAVPASVMKINSVLLSALAGIAAGSERPVEFHFFPLGARGVAFYYLEREIKRQLPGAVVHPEVTHDEYLKLVAACAFFVCPFPYGNMNSIVDAVSLGLPGVCLDGPEAHSHADVAFFARMGLPKALAAATIEEYVAAGVKLCNDKAWLAKCRKAARACDMEKRFFAGDARQFSEAVYALVKT
jgi:HMW1C N-terminal/HMW1 domain 2